MSPRFLILETGRPVDRLRRHGGFGHWIRVAAGLRADQASVCEVDRGADLPSIDGWAGVLVSGSSAMVSDREPWSERSADWLRQAHEQDVPLLGICYGHQLIAHALGGRVDFHPQGREMGTVEMHCLPAAAEDPLLGHLPGRFRAQMSHLQSVIEPPRGAILLARSAHEAHGAFRIGRQTWGLQFHPEFSASHMRGYIQARAEALRRESTDPLALHRAVAPAPLARSILRRFIAVSRRLRSTRRP